MILTVTNETAGIVLKVLERYFTSSKQDALEIGLLWKVFPILEKKHGISLYESKEGFHQDVMFLKRLGHVDVEKIGTETTFLALTAFGLKKGWSIELADEVKKVPGIVNELLRRSTDNAESESGDF
jgi:hypothetical protein